MEVNKLKPHSMPYGQLLSEKAERVRRSAAKIVNDARGAVHTSQNVIARSHEVLEKAEKELKELKAKKAQRAKKKAT